MTIDWLAANDQGWNPTHGLFVEMWENQEPRPGIRAVPRGLSRMVLDQFDSYEEARSASQDLVRAAADFAPSFTMKMPSPPKWYAVRVLVRELNEGAPGKALRSVEILAIPSRPAQSWQIVEGADPVINLDPSRLHAGVVVQALIAAYFDETEGD